MKHLIGILITIGSIILGIYVGVWVMCVQPIMDVCMAIDNHTISASIVGVAVIKILFSSVVGGLIAYIGTVIGTFLTSTKTKRRKIRRRNNGKIS